jgi:hypothetical protein
MDRRSFSCALAAGYFALALTPLQSQEAKQEWGNLSATFVYDGEPPERQELVVDKEKKDAFTLPLLDESLVVDAESKGVGNVVVWLRAAKDAPPQVHPSYEESLKKPQEVLIQNGRFEPHITTVRVGQQYIIRNGDKVGHAAKADFFLNRFGCDLLIPGGTSQASFNKSEGRPVVLADVYYSWMSGYLLVLDHPYMAVSDKQGKLQIKNLPVGNHTFVLFHELPGFVREAKRNGEVQEFKYGRLTVDIKPGDNDLGEFHIKPEKKRFP